ncbi:snRNA-activating protein complex subunit 1 [Eumeta japonica]|uniref:snRNA-activating protein complex subunit 1 n=1 Tax=Eumeta variegata TaxID=151549 RepID=A0A4C1XZI2_EUMVA|nr:snRNA-activating protein complex subunit 1 [Eumeta japonica]
MNVSELALPPAPRGIAAHAFRYCFSYQLLLRSDVRVKSSYLKISKQPEITLVYIADGFEEDCEALLQRYLICNIHNYQAFCKIWKEMKFSYIFHGRISTAELGEFSEEVLHIVKKILVKKINNMEEAIGAMFLLYGLVHLQPFKKFAHIRLVPEDVSAINKIEAFAREHKRYDVLFILGSLLIEGPVQYHLADKEYGLERSMKKSFEETVSIEKLSLMKGVLYQNMELLDVLQAETNISQKYKNAKSILHAGPGKHQPQHELDYSNEHLAGELISSLKQLLRCGTFFEKMSNGKQIISNTAEPGTTVVHATEIKQRAMRNMITPMRHLLSIHAVDSKEPSKESINQKLIKDSNSKRDSRKILDISLKGKSKRRKILPHTPKEESMMVDCTLPNDGGVNNLEAVDVASLPILTENSEIKTVSAVIEFIDEIEAPSKRSETSTAVGNESELNERNPASDEISLEDSNVEKDLKIRRVPYYKKSTLNKLGMLPIANVTEHHPKRKTGFQPKRADHDELAYESDDENNELFQQQEAESEELHWTENPFGEVLTNNLIIVPPD